MYVIVCRQQQFCSAAFGYLLLLLLEVLHAQDEDESSLHLFICLVLCIQPKKIGKKLLVCHVGLPLPIRSRLSTTATVAALRAAGQESAYQVWRSRVGVKLCVHAMLNYRLLPLEDGGNLHLIEDHGVYQFA